MSTGHNFLLMISLIVTLLMITAPSAQAQAPTVGLRNTVQVTLSGLRCSINGLVGTNTTNTNIFSNAAVQVRCGRALIGVGMTDATGSANVTISTPIYSDLCTLRINTPLSTCDPQLPSTGRLVSQLKFVTTATPTLFQVLNIR